LSDAPRVQLLAGDRDVAKTTQNIAHPYEDGIAEKWIGSHQERFEKDIEVVFAVTIKGRGELVGAIGLTLSLSHESAELGYWVGTPFWGQGYCTEAAHAVLRYAFTDLRLNRVHAHHFSSNPASGRVMQKIGMLHEGHLRQHVKKWGEFLDVEACGILRSEFELR
jgi:RimJ/RimL family protein N-acetyltransferase